MNKYLPGTYTISPQDSKRSEKIGWWSLAVTAILGIVLVASDAPEWLKVVLFIPAAISGLAFLQSIFSFGVVCDNRSLFTMKTWFAKKPSKIAATFTKKDQQKASLLLAGAVLIGIAITLSAFSA